MLVKNEDVPMQFKILTIRSIYDTVKTFLFTSCARYFLLHLLIFLFIFFGGEGGGGRGGEWGEAMLGAL